MPFHDRYIRFDWAIKRLLRQKANFDVLEGFLTVFLQEEIKIVEILESEGNQFEETDKFNRVDIKAKNSKGEIIIIEVQNTRESHFLERILYGAAKAITEHIALGESYAQVRKVYSISILYFDLGEGSDYLYHGQNRFVGIHTHDELLIKSREKDAIVTRTPAHVFPEYILIRVNEFNQVAKTPLEEWMRYLKEGIIDDDATAPGLPEARQRLIYYNMSDEERRAYERHLDAVMRQNDMFSSAHEDGWNEGKKEGIEEGKKEGIELGKKEALIATARNMKLNSIPLPLIMQCTGLSEEEILGL